MTTNHSPDGMTEQNFNSMKQNIRLLSAQIRNGRVDGQFLSQQVSKLEAFFENLEEERKSARQGSRFRALYEVSRILGSSLDLQEVLDQVMDAVLKLTQAERGFLMLRDGDGGLEVKVERNLDLDAPDTEEPQGQYSRTIANQVLDDGRAIVTTNAAEDPRFNDENNSIMAQALRTIMATPLRARGEVIGVAYVDSRVVTEMFDEDDLNAMDALAGQAAIAIENAKLFEQTDAVLQKTVNELTQLRRVDLMLNETLDPDRAIEITLEWAAKMSNSVSGHLGMLEGKPAIVPASRHYGSEDRSKPPARLDLAYEQVGEVIQTGEARTGISLIGDDEHCILIIPIKRENKVFGIVVLHKDNTNPYTPHETELAQRVVARASVAIENARLYAEVQAADRAKSEFVGTVAHDLKVPMTSIMGYANLTMMLAEEHENLVDRQGEFLDKIADTVERMEVLVSDLSDLSRVEAGYFFMDPIVVPVAKIVEGVKDNTMTQIQARGHTFIEDVAPDLPDMWIDYYRLLQVLTNLVSNAYKYTPEGGTITLSAKQSDNRIRFSVSDTGIGLSEEQIAKMGTKFWRADDEYTRSQQGTGLGFSITSSLVELMGSYIKIESEPGSGSTFSFSIAIAANGGDPNATQALNTIPGYEDFRPS